MVWESVKRNLVISSNTIAIFVENIWISQRSHQRISLSWVVLGKGECLEIRLICLVQSMSFMEWTISSRTWTKVHETLWKLTFFIGIEHSDCLTIFLNSKTSSEETSCCKSWCLIDFRFWQLIVLVFLQRLVSCSFLSKELLKKKLESRKFIFELWKKLTFFFERYQSKFVVRLMSLADPMRFFRPSDGKSRGPFSFFGTDHKIRINDK